MKKKQKKKSKSIYNLIGKHYHSYQQKQKVKACAILLNVVSVVWKLTTGLA
jgi:hypothetical protein